MENEKNIEIFWDDLTEEVQQKILDLLGDNGNYDVFPIATIYGNEEEEEIVQENEEDEAADMGQTLG